MPKMTAISFTHTTYGKPHMRVDRGLHRQSTYSGTRCELTMDEAMLISQWATRYIRTHKDVYFNLYPCGFYIQV